MAKGRTKRGKTASEKAPAGAVPPGGPEPVEGSVPPPTPQAKQNSKKTTTNPLTFLQQVRSEVSKVVWPTRRETTVSTIFVLVFVFIAALFFLAVDQVLSFLTGFLFA